MAEVHPIAPKKGYEECQLPPTLGKAEGSERKPGYVANVNLDIEVD